MKSSWPHEHSMSCRRDMDTRRACRGFSILAILAGLQFVTANIAAAQSFTDVPPDHWAASFIEILAGNGITSGCGGTEYCPDVALNRAKMAVFLERGMRGSSFLPPPATGNRFLDVAPNDFGADYIEQLANDGITAGCGNNNYCPGELVTRAQMAVFLLRAKYGSAYLPPAPTGLFGDVDTSHWAAAWIEQLAVEGITSGCGGGNFCPDNPVERDQMAVFLVRAFDLSLPDPDTYTGPAARDADVLAYQQELWVNIEPSNRCGSCHNQTIGQVPLFARDDDVNQAYDAILPFVDTMDPSASIIVTKVASGHNCWVADPAACGAIMTTWIENWLGALN